MKDRILDANVLDGFKGGNWGRFLRQRNLRAQQQGEASNHSYARELTAGVRQRSLL